MKKLIYLLMSLLWLSCANENKNKSESVVYEMEDASTNKAEMSMDISTINYEHIAARKLIDYFDLLRLKKEHPEFEKDIALQLKSFTENFALNKSDQNIDSIKNIHQDKVLIEASDSIQKMILYFDVFSNNVVKTDSILAVVKTKSVVMDGLVVPTTKVSFQKID